VLVELAVADAYGAGFEMRSSLRVRIGNDLQRYRRPSLSLHHGRYTDDTQLTIAIAEALLSGEEWTPRLVADHLVAAATRDPRAGYAPRFGRFIRSLTDGQDLLDRIRPTSERGGAAMRASPIGLLPDIALVIERATQQARVTHDTDGGVHSAQAAALMVHWFHHLDGDPGELAAFISDHVPGPWQQPWKGRVSMAGIDCVHAAITSIHHERSLAGLLRHCVAWGGDVDTAATIAVAAASRSTAYQHDLPQRLIDDLEDGPYGRSFLTALDDRLLDEHASS
jgi:ADP-ribosyl-[dinitrogen reductase] hydrolase